ncbi:unnamed protein product [Symbiodinium natans]|uniref:C3H1-type domain-containing protein n=1 Tax=Symbiodinium natans TaxID=878477 RepID=A0A812IJ65_9DINO|nr:unnamed protein product [Symbiodinium natans]
MHATAMDLVVAPELMLPEAGLSRLQIVLLLGSSTLALLSVLFQLVLERHGHKAGGWTAPNEAVSPGQGFVSDPDFQIGRLLSEHSVTPKPVSLASKRRVLAWWAWWIEQDASRIQETQLQDPPQKLPGSSHPQRKLKHAKEATEVAWKAGMEGMDVQGAREPMEEALPFQKKWHPECEMQAFERVPLRKTDLMDLGDLGETAEAPDVPPMPFQKKRDAKLGPGMPGMPGMPEPPSLQPLPFQWRDQELRQPGQLGRTAPEPSAWPLPFSRDKHPQAQSLGIQDEVQDEVQSATLWDTRQLATDPDEQDLAPWAWHPMRLQESATNAPQPASWDSLHLAAPLPVPMPPTLGPPPGLPPPPVPPPPPAHFATLEDDNIQPRLMRPLRESLRESSIPSELSQSNPLAIPSIGSFGHPDMCYRPCVYLEKGSCKRDAFCTHCHFDHEKTYKLAKNQKRFIETQLDEVSVLAALLPFIHAKAIERGLQREVSNLCALIQRRVEFLRSRVSVRAVPVELARSLPRLPLHTLLGILIRRSDFEPEFMDDLTVAVAQVRAAIPTSLRSICEGIPERVPVYTPQAR